ncbi:MAG TPA: hypothetical protein PKN33_16175 [Phycisphaerae bacterium]|nr:hypothetical protein [Phycisphaerae bacterium]
MKFASTFLVVVLFVSATAMGRDDALPKAEDVLDRFVEVTGGAEAYAKIHSRRERMELYLSYESEAAIVTTETARPKDARGRVEFADGRVTEWGFHDGIGWSVSPEGVSVESGEQLKWSEYDAQVGWETNRRALYESMTVESRALFDGVECFKLRITTKSGLEQTHYLEIKTGLRRGLAMTQKMPYGTREVSRVFTDYRPVDGVMLAHKMVGTNRILESGAEWTTTIKSLSIEHNVGFQSDHFEPPAEVKARLKKSASATGD